MARLTLRLLADLEPTLAACQLGITMASLGLLLLSLYLAGVGSGPRAGGGSGSGRRFYGRRPGRG